ncbi:unnamed protein product, partial [Rotaria sp. Silwood1]
VAIPIYYGSTSHQYVCLRLYHSVLSLKFSFISDQSRPNLSADYRAFEEIMRNVPLAELDPKEDIVNIIKDLRSAFTMST